MTSHPGRYVGLCFLLLVFSVVAPPVADWLRTTSQLPSGYGAGGDRQRASRIPPTAADRWRGTHMPGPVRKTVESLSAGTEGSWVKETVENGAWVYELHVTTNAESSVIRIAPNGDVIPPVTPDPEPGSPAGVSG